MSPQDDSSPAAPAHPPAADAAASAPPPLRRRNRWLGATLAIGAVALLGGAAWYLVQRAQAPAGGGFPGGRMMVTVGEATARQADLPVTIEALGTVTPLATVTLRAQVSGVLTEVLFTEGQRVKKGQVLARIDPRPFEQALTQAQGARQRDQAQLDNARIVLERYRTLLAQDSIARQDVDTQAALVRQLQGTVTTDLAQEQAAQLNLGYTRITAPTNGRIGLRAVDAGNYVGTGDTNGIATLTQEDPIDVAFAIPQDRLGDVQAAQRGGAPLAVTAFDRTRTRALAQGRFLTLDNQVDTATGTVKAKARFDNADGALFPNQFVNVRLLLRQDPAVVVPVTAVRTGANGDFVYVINEDRTVSLRKVRRGQATVSQVAIAEGLKAGERVVTEGGDRLKDGVKVQLQGPQGQRPGGGSADGAPGRRPRSSDAQGEGRHHRQRPDGAAPGQAPAAQGAPGAPAAAASGPAAPAASQPVAR